MHVGLLLQYVLSTPEIIYGHTQTNTINRDSTFLLLTYSLLRFTPFVGFVWEKILYKVKKNVYIIISYKFCLLVASNATHIPTGISSLPALAM